MGEALGDDDGVAAVVRAAAPPSLRTEDRRTRSQDGHITARPVTRPPITRGDGTADDPARRLRAAPGGRCPPGPLLGGRTALPLGRASGACSGPARSDRRGGCWWSEASSAGWSATGSTWSSSSCSRSPPTRPVSDVVYISSYGVMAAGLVVIVRRRGSRGDLPALLDAAILAAGTAVVVGVFLVAPITGDSSLTFLGKLTSSLYPIGDVLLLGILARLWTTPGARTVAFKLLAGAFALTLAGDALYNYSAIRVARDHLPRQRRALAGRLRAARGCGVVPLGLVDVAGPLPGREDLSDPTKRMAVLTARPAAAGVRPARRHPGRRAISGVLIATGSILLSILVLARMAGLLSVVRAQAVQLAALARSDGLTGVAQPPHARPRAVARLSGGPRQRHPVDPGDHRPRPLQDATTTPSATRPGTSCSARPPAAWADILDERRDPGPVRRRGVRRSSSPARPPAEARVARAGRCCEPPPADRPSRRASPPGTRRPSPGAVLSGADIAMYNAKSQGRNRVCIAVDEPAAQDDAVRLQIVLQPIVDLATREPVRGRGAEPVRRRRPRDGVRGRPTATAHGWSLEAAAVTAALAVRPPGLLLSINVSLGGLGTPPVRDALSGDLTGVILEITENADLTSTP